jgi:hypothetical protein
MRWRINKERYDPLAHPLSVNGAAVYATASRSHTSTGTFPEQPAAAPGSIGRSSRFVSRSVSTGYARHRYRCGFFSDHGAVVDHREGDDERAGGAASAALWQIIRVELQYLAVALLYRCIEWAERVALRICPLLGRERRFVYANRSISGKLRRDQSRRSA